MSYENYKYWKANRVLRPQLSIVIPAYNEAQRIIPTLGAIAAYIAERELAAEVIVADDGSTDMTVQLLQQLQWANLRILIADQNGGKGSAVRRGMLAARGELLLFADADNATPIEELDKLLPYVTQRGADVVIGSRAVTGATVANKSGLRRLLSGGLHLIVKRTLRLEVRDTQCGFKLFTRAAAERLFSAQQTMGFSFDLEILYLAGKWQMAVRELPVCWHDAPGSKVDPLRETVNFLRDLLAIKGRDLFHDYNTRQWPLATLARVA